MADIYFNYNISGRIMAPEGSTITDVGTGIRLPNGDVIKLWEQAELHPGGDADTADNIAFDELQALGVFYDGDCCEFEEVELTTDQFWPPKS